MPMWIPVAQNAKLRSAQGRKYAAPLTNSYPPGVFFATATNAANLSPGQPTTMTRVLGPRGTDPRSGGSGFMSLSTSTAVDKVIAGLQPSNIGGSNINLAPNGDYSPLILAIVAAVAVLMVFK